MYFNMNRKRCFLLCLGNLVIAAPIACSSENDNSSDGNNSTSECPAGSLTCGGQCVDVTANPYNCGACGNVCGSAQVCVAGQCTCQAGLSDCGGTCVDLMSDGENCGACGATCLVGTFCSAGSCGTSCPVGQQPCEQSCVNLMSDVRNCGGCGIACPAGQVCLNSSCSCPTGQQLCGTICTDVAVDSFNCGMCGIICPTGATCIAGVCQGGGTGGSPGTGGGATGGGATGGIATGGIATGGIATGGIATGGLATGGIATGGTSTGGLATGGITTGGASTGGLATGGASTGGLATGGASTGGEATGGSPTGGSGTGGTDPGGYDTSISEGEFSFFVISMEYILQVSGGTLSGGKGTGLGGDLGGLDGADAHCAAAAQQAVPGDNHLWRAFLSVSDYNGTGQVDAIDRIGTGPWYNVDGLLVATGLDGLANNLRPDGSTEIVYSSSSSFGGSQDWPFNQCLTNESGTCLLAEGDNHDVLTGSGEDGRLVDNNSGSTCDNWTNNTTNYGSPQIGHAWPRQLNANDSGSAHWICTGSHRSSGCGPKINISESNDHDGGVGSDGGYGAWYCFAVSE